MRLYNDVYGVTQNEEVNNILFKIKSFLEKSKQELTEEEYKLLFVQVHNELRENCNLLNKIFTIVVNKEGTKAAIIYFPKEPDGKCYEAQKDEDGRIYIIVDEE